MGERLWDRVLRGAVAAGDLVLPSRCASCHGPGPPLCRACTDAVRTASGNWPAPVRLDPAPGGMPECWAAATFDGALRLAVTAYKDEGRRDLRPALGRLLAAALATAATADPALRQRVSAGEPVLVVPLPTSRASRRRRGDDPVGDLARFATASDPGRGLVAAPALAHTRRVADQAHLDRGQRAANLAGAIEVSARWQPVVGGAACVVVDDVVTTGATLAEAARALRRAGAGHVVAATVAATPRRL
jgi:predicted amidophosphoribosyltransferase